MCESFFHWFAGFLDGEGSFIIQVFTDKRSNKAYCTCYVSIGLRYDDLPILEKIQMHLGMGRIYHYTSRNQDGREMPTVMWKVFRIDDLIHLVKILDDYPLRSKKRKDYEIWREAVMEKSKGRGDRCSIPRTYDIEYLRYLASKLRKLRVRSFA